MSTQLAVVEPTADEPTTALALAPAKNHELLPPANAYQQMRAMAKDLYESKIMPAGIGNWQSAFAVMQKGRELGIPPMAAIEGISIVKGKPTCGAHLMLALVKRDYGPGAIRVARSTPTECVVEWREVGWSGVQSYAYTINDAQTAGLAGGDTWKKYPAAMLRARCISAVVKMAFPEVVGGMMLPDELGASVTVDDAGEVVIVDPGGLPQREAARSSPEPPSVRAEVLPDGNGSDRAVWVETPSGTVVDAETGEIVAAEPVDAESRVVDHDPASPGLVAWLIRKCNDLGIKGDDWQRRFWDGHVGLREQDGRPSRKTVTVAGAEKLKDLLMRQPDLARDIAGNYRVDPAGEPTPEPADDEARRIYLADLMRGGSWAEVVAEAGESEPAWLALALAVEDAGQHQRLAAEAQRAGMMSGALRATLRSRAVELAHL